MTKNIIYFGSPAFSAQILEAILKFKIKNCKFRVVAAVTSPDRPTGRHQKLTPSPIAQLASKYDLPVFKPEKFDEANLSHLKLLKPDYFLVVSYGQIIPDSYLAAAKTLNVHFSLLPKYRGALCIQEALKNGDSETGVTLMEMESKLDAGPIIAQEKVAIDLDDNVATLTAKLTQSAIHLLNFQFFPRHTRDLEYSTIFNFQISHKQDESLASYTPSHKTLTRQSAFIDWETIHLSTGSEPAGTTGSEPVKMHNLIRSLNPDPGAWTIINGKEVKILKTSLAKSEISNIKFQIDLVQLSGKSPISWNDFSRGHQL